MTAKDIYHNTVNNALVKDAWTITHDPFTLSFDLKGVYVDLGAEKPLAAEKVGVGIAVEIKSFRSASDIRDFEVAIRQYVFCRSTLAHALNLTANCTWQIPERVYRNTFHEAIVLPTLEDLQPLLIVFDAEKEEI